MEKILITYTMAKELKAKRVMANIKGSEVNKKYGKAMSWITKLESGEIKKLDKELYESLINYYGDSLNDIRVPKISDAYYENKIAELERENAKLKELLQFYIYAK